MHSLVSATLDRRVVVDGDTHVVRAALTGEALAILAALEHPSDGNWDVVVETAYRWLPKELADTILKQDRGQALHALHGIIMEGMPPIDRVRSEENLDRPVYRSRDEWEDLAADYMHAYGISATQLLAEPWGAFVLFASKIQQVLARDQYRYLQAKGLAYIKDPVEQKRAYNDLIERGKLPVPDPEAERERKLKLQRKWLEDLDFEFEMIKRNPRA